MLVEITNRYFKTASNHMIVKVTKFFYSVVAVFISSIKTCLGITGVGR